MNQIQGSLSEPDKQNKGQFSIPRSNKMEELSREKGQVTAVSDKGTKYGIAIGKDNWFNGMGKVPCKKGDNVEVTYKQEGMWKNIDQVYVTSHSPAPALKPGPSDSNKYNMQMSKLKNQTNARCAALTAAKDLCIARDEKDGAQVLRIAKEFLDFIEEDVRKEAEV